MRLLGKGQTAQAIKDIYPDIVMYDDSDLNSFDKNSDEVTIVSPGIPPHNDLVKNTKNLISEYDLFESIIPFSIWISGTNGKTTTTQMLQHLLEDKGSVAGGNIGTPLAKMDKKAKIWILETSSFTLHYTQKAKPNIYILLPISDDHISWHGSFKEYENSKLKILSTLLAEDIALVPLCYKSYPSKAKITYYKDSSNLASQFNIEKEKIKFKEPFLMDALLALVVNKILYKEINYNKINTFIQDVHKLEEFRDNQNRIWVDDSKATNIDATIQALKSYKDKKIYLILGGDDKGAKLESLFDVMSQYDIEIFAIGTNTKRLNSLADKYNIKCNMENKIEKAVKHISNLLLEDDINVALLSPAAASLDQFSSYKQRGEKFKEIVLNLSKY